MRKLPCISISRLLLATVVGLTGSATLSTGHASGTTKTITLTPSKQEEPLPTQVLASLQKLMEVEPSIKHWKMMGYYKTPISRTGEIRGVWNVIMHETGNIGEEGKHSADMQFDSTTGILQNYRGGPFPAAKVPSRQKEYYKQRGQEIMNQLLGRENAKQFKTIDYQGISTANANGITRELGSITFKSEKETIELSFDSDGRLEIYRRILLPLQKK
ncbi:hypothetical protein [Brevibacillus sp. 179-C9.3 HS]|uniref:hypothetical protein n=1 Tax=unclassified Brevibacillus TaxID=2684853 RepID=UPI0039A3C4D6